MPWGCFRWWIIPLASFFGVTSMPHAAWAIPQFARRYDLQCSACHTVVPMLNARGQDFLQRGYRPPPGADLPGHPAVPLAVWITMRQEDQLDRNFGEGFLSRVELISGGPLPISGSLGETLSYFLEWRLVSLEGRSNGRLRDRSGRFEDAYLTWQPMDRLQITAGQFRSLTQVDVSRRLSLSEPAVFSTSLPGNPAAGNPRITALRSFAPSGRQPAVMVQFQSITGESEADGLFHSAVLPFVGEWSLPLTPEAHQEASFVSQGPPKGAFLETYYRQDLSSIGGHAFMDDDRWLCTLVGTLNPAGLNWAKDWYVTAAIGVDDSDLTPRRTRSSLEVLFLPTCEQCRWFRGGIGFRAEHITGPGTRPAYVPFVVLSSPNTAHFTFLLQAEYRHQENNRAFLLDFSIVF